MSRTKQAIETINSKWYKANRDKVLAKHQKKMEVKYAKEQEIMKSEGFLLPNKKVQYEDYNLVKWMVATDTKFSDFKLRRKLSSMKIHGNTYYHFMDKNGKLTYLHRAIAIGAGILDGVDDKRELHHINKDTSDNRADNLIAVTKIEHRHIHKEA